MDGLTLAAAGLTACLVLPLYGEAGPESCLSPEQLQRRSVVLQCGTPGVSGFVSKAAELNFIITGERADVEGMAGLAPDARYYRCILQKSR